MARNTRQRHDPQKNLVGFYVGDMRYAVRVADVREITNPLGVAALPQAPHGVSGVADYRGEVVAVVDMRARFGLLPVAATKKTKWIVVEAAGAGGGQRVAIVVDGVTEVFAGSPLGPPPAFGHGQDIRAIAGVTRKDDSLVFVLDVSRLRAITDGLVLPDALAAGLDASGTLVVGRP